jgi:hypothetical protein
VKALLRCPYGHDSEFTRVLANQYATTKRYRTTCLTCGRSYIEEYTIVTHRAGPDLIPIARNTFTSIYEERTETSDRENARIPLEFVGMKGFKVQYWGGHSLTFITVDE